MLFSLAIVFTTGCGEKGTKVSGDSEIGIPRGDESFGDVVKRRGLNAEDVLSAAKNLYSR